MGYLDHAREGRCVSDAELQAERDALSAADRATLDTLYDGVEREDLLTDDAWYAYIEAATTQDERERRQRLHANWEPKSGS